MNNKKENNKGIDWSEIFIIGLMTFIFTMLLSTMNELSYVKGQLDTLRIMDSVYKNSHNATIVIKDTNNKVKGNYNIQSKW